MIVTHKISIDLLEPGKEARIYAVQDDKYSRNLEISLLSGGIPWEAPEHTDVVIRYIKPDGTAGAYDTLPDGTAAWWMEGSTLTVALAPQVLTAPGLTCLAVTLLWGVRELSTFALQIAVQPRPGAGITESEDYQGVTNFLRAPDTAQAGQYLRVAAVDENGHITGLETAQIQIPSAGAGIRPNLLHNWYFQNPVNQRGQTSYVSTNGIYGIDRWMGGGYNAPYSFGENGLVFPAGDVWVLQQIENHEELIGKMVTLSTICNGQLYSVTGTFSNQSGDNYGLRINLGDGLYFGQNGANSIRFASFSATTAEKVILAVKLEIGDSQTLAHQDANGNWVLNERPDFGQELAKCQRYFQVFSEESLRPAKAVDFRPVMRTEPVLSTVTVDGETYYSASADL